MRRQRSKIPKQMRERAKQLGLRYYNNGKPCKHAHTPIVRLTSSGRCWRCTVEAKDDRPPVTRAIYLRFKRRDGTIDVIGPFTLQTAAVTAYKRMYEKEYGVPCPRRFFYPVGENARELEDSVEPV